MQWFPVCVLVFLGVVSCATQTQASYPPSRSESTDDLLALSKSELERAKRVALNYGVSKNNVLMIGDGLGISTITSARIFKGQKSGTAGEETKLNLEVMPHVALSKTYNIDRQVSDSAGTATAMLTGVKTNYGVVGLASSVPLGNDCANVNNDTKLPTLIDFALQAGKSVGVVTTTRITHATPASAYSHTPNRLL